MRNSFRCRKRCPLLGPNLANDDAAMCLAVERHEPHISMNSATLRAIEETPFSGGHTGPMILHDEDFMSHPEASAIAQKLDRVVLLLEGDEQMIGLVSRVNMLEELLLGRRGKDGMAHQVRTMWRIHVWLLCTISAAGGVFGRELFVRIFH